MSGSKVVQQASTRLRDMVELTPGVLISRISQTLACGPAREAAADRLTRVLDAEFGEGMSRRLGPSWFDVMIHGGGGFELDRLARALKWDPDPGRSGQARGDRGRRALVERAEQNNRSVEAEVFELSRLGLLLAASEVMRPQTIRFRDGSWLCHTKGPMKGRKVRMKPYDLEVDKAIEWFASKAKEAARATLLNQPFPGRQSRDELEAEGNAIPLEALTREEVEKAAGWTPSPTLRDLLAISAGQEVEAETHYKQVQCMLQAATPGQREVVEAVMRHQDAGLSYAEAKRAAARDRGVGVAAIERTLQRLRDRPAVRELGERLFPPTRRAAG